MLTGLQYGGEVPRDIMAAVYKTMKTWSCTNPVGLWLALLCASTETAGPAIIQQELDALHAA